MSIVYNAQYKIIVTKKKQDQVNIQIIKTMTQRLKLSIFSAQWNIGLLLMEWTPNYFFAYFIFFVFFCLCKNCLYDFIASRFLFFIKKIFSCTTLLLYRRVSCHCKLIAMTMINVDQTQCLVFLMLCQCKYLLYTIFYNYWLLD